MKNITSNLILVIFLHKNTVPGKKAGRLRGFWLNMHSQEKNDVSACMV